MDYFSAGHTFEMKMRMAELARDYLIYEGSSVATAHSFDLAVLDKARNEAINGAFREIFACFSKLIYYLLDRIRMLAVFA